MIRLLSGVVLAAGLLALALSGSEAPTAVGQEKEKGKAKAKTKQKEKDKTPDPADAKDDLERVVIAFDPGSHTRPITALGFNKDQSKLITVGCDYSIQIWSTSTGERLDILRLPAYGRDNGFDKDRWDQAVVSPDGEFVAIGGATKQLWDEKPALTRLLIVDLSNKRVRKTVIPIGPRSSVTSLAFSKDGDRLAVGTGGELKSIYLIDDVRQMMRVLNDGRRPSPPRMVFNEFKGDVNRVDLSPSGDRLVAGDDTGRVSAWDVTGPVLGSWKPLGGFEAANRTDLLAWSPDGSHFARSWVGGGGANRGIELRGPDGKQLKGWTYQELTPGFGVQTVGATFRYLTPDRLFVSAHGGIGKGDGSGALGVVLDPTTGKTVRRFVEPVKGMFLPHGAASPGGDLAATTTSRGLEAVIYRLSDGKIVARCGNRTPIPTVVAWSKDPKAPAVAWSDDREKNPFNSTLEDLTAAFDLSKIEPVVKLTPANFMFRQLTVGDWKLEHKTGAGTFANVTLKEGDKEAKTLFRNPARSLTLVPNGDKPPLLAHAHHDYESQTGANAVLSDSEGKTLAVFRPMATDYRDMVASPDGRFLLVSTATHRLTIYRTDGSTFPLLNIVRANGEWVAWTPEGYYAASPGGDKLIGWAVTNGANEFVTYYPAERYAKHFHRPDVIRMAFEKGSLKEALAALKTSAPPVETILPPKAGLTLVEQRGEKVIVKATASSGAKDKPLAAMRVLLDGRPLPEGKGVWKPVPGMTAEEQFEIEIPAGTHELKLLVRGEDGSTVSEPVTVRGPKSTANQPSLHRVCVGVNDYDAAGLKLGSAVKDCQDMFAALGTYCVGPDNRYRTTKGDLILNKEATRDSVLKALADVRKAAKPGDLVVFFFAGHGVKQGDAFYLLTREADVAKDLKGLSLSGEDLRKTLAEVECPVLLILDACHSAKAVQSFRPATDDLTRSLTDDTVGVTVMSAAMAHETAGATVENGFFTAGLLKGLKAGEGVPFDPYERQLYVHHLYSVAYSEVRRATNGKQNPFLNMPWTVPPLPLREVPKP